MTFGAGASFEGATFGDDATFFCAAFGTLASFDCALFEGYVSFIGEPNPSEKKDDPENSLKRHRQLWEHRGSGPDRFQSISFANARFNIKQEFSDGANFSGRRFEGVVDFSNARFFEPPIFYNVTNVAQINFTTSTRVGFVLPGKRHWTFDSKIPIQLRALRKIAEETKNHDLERDLYIEERRAERGVYLRQRWKALKKEGWKNWLRNSARLATHLHWIGIMGFYWVLADYGRSIVVPAIWLGLSVPFFSLAL